MIERRSSTGATNDQDDLARPADLFAAGLWRAVALAPSLLPPAPDGLVWRHEGRLALGVQHVSLPGTEPEPVITGVAARGFYVWRISTDETASL